MRYVTWNIRHGTDQASEPRLGAQGRLLAELEADVVMLQEVDIGVERSGFEDQLSVLSRLSGLEYRVFGANLQLGAGEYGTAVLSRWPVLEWANEPVPQWHAPGVYVIGEDGKPHLPEARGVLHARLDTPCGPLRCITTHASIHDLERREGARIITKLAAAADGCWIVGGDMNAGAAENADILGALGPDLLAASRPGAVTFPGTSVAIDRIWSCTAGRADVVETDLSDHHIVVLDI